MQVWRMRFRCNEHEVTEQAWKKNLIGIWYGAWTAEDFNKAISLRTSDPIEYLTNLPAQKALDWGGPFPKRFFDTAMRFWSIGEEDWVFTYFADAIHLAHVCSVASTSRKSEFNFDGEIFKFREVEDKKSFELSKLPDSFRRLTMSGRSNVHGVPSVSVLIEILANSKNEKEATSAFGKLDWESWMDALGPEGWESLSLGYLIWEESFVPGGLKIGATLPVFDIVGKSRSGVHILAQCKKDPNPITLDDTFLEACTAIDHDSKLFLFAYSGCKNAPSKVEVVTGEGLRHWFDSSAHGREYRRLLHGT